MFGTDVNGSRSWLKLGFISIQASEFMRSFLMIYLYHFKDKYSYLSDFKFIVYSFMIVLVPSVLTFIEPDTGGVILYLSVWLFFIILKKINKFYYIGGIAVLCILRCEPSACKGHQSTVNESVDETFDAGVCRSAESACCRPP